MKKRFLALALSGAVCLSMIGTAFAAASSTIESDNGWIDLEPGLYEVYDENGDYKDTIRVDNDGIISNPDAVTPGSSINGQTVVKPDNPGPGPSESVDPGPGPTTPVRPPYYPSTPSTPSNPSFSITAPASTTGGKVTLSSTSAKKGDTVTITVTPDKGYKLDKLTVTDSKGNVIQTRDQGDGKYTFTMPAGTVNVSATFVAVPQITFIDVAPGAYYADAVAWAVEKGITNGTSATTFSPNSPCTRAQIVTFLWRAMGSPVVGANTSFTDVPAGEYYAQAVAWAVANGITNGTSATEFSPNSPCTRAQAVTFLHRAEGTPFASAGGFSDVGSGAYYANAVSWAVSKGVTNGTSATTFSPDDTCTRGQIVTFLYRDMAG